MVAEATSHTDYGLPSLKNPRRVNITMSENRTRTQSGNYNRFNRLDEVGGFLRFISGSVPVSILPIADAIVALVFGNGPFPLHKSI